jgi:hypothetical protein
MIIINFFLTIFSLNFVTGPEFKCGLSTDPFYEIFNANVKWDTIVSTDVCGFRPGNELEGPEKVNVHQENKTDADVNIVVYASTLNLIFPLELFKKLPNLEIGGFQSFAWVRPSSIH